MPTPKPKTDPLGAIVDELHALDLELAPWKPKFDRRELLKKNLRAEFADKPADEPFTIRGLNAFALLGPKGHQQSVNVVKLAKLISLRALSRIASVTMKALGESDISAVITSQVVESSQTGPRELKVLANGQAQA